MAKSNATTAKPLALSTPIRADGSANAMLGSALRKKFKNITIYEQDGETVKAVLHSEDEKAVQNIGTLSNFMFALVDSWLSGVGQGPDGSRRYVAEHLKEVQDGTSSNVRNYVIKAIPAGRSGLKGYTASIGDLLTMVTIQSKILEASEEEHGLQRSTIRKSKKEAELPEVTF